MNLQQKLDLIDEEIRKFHMFCSKSGYNSYQIEVFAEPFLTRDVHEFTTMIWASGKAWKRRMVALTTVCIVALFLFRFDPAYQLASAVSKTGAMQILPVWDWTQIYDTRCWVENPLYQQQSSSPGLQLRDCEICEGIERVERPDFISGQELMTKYVRRDTPVIVRDESVTKQNFNLTQLAKLFNVHPVLKKYSSCRFSTNIRHSRGDHVDLMRDYLNSELDRFYAFWENCQTDSAKVLRGVYRRPKVLPPSVSMARSNWLFIASNYSGKMYKPVDVSHSMVVFMQMKGVSRIKLEPWRPCDQICAHFVEVLEEGEILITTDFMWRVDYQPVNSSENIAFAFGASFD